MLPRINQVVPHAPIDIRNYQPIIPPGNPNAGNFDAAAQPINGLRKNHVDEIEKKKTIDSNEYIE